MKSRLPEHAYRQQGRGLLRAARMPAHSAETSWPNLVAGPVESWRAWLAGIWRRDSTAEAIGLASPVLAQQIQRICDGTVRKPKDVRKAVVAVTRYLLREVGRPTPFGLFAGVAEVRFGPVTMVRWDDRHRLYIRADSEWLAEVIKQLESHPDLLARLPVMSNSLNWERVDRLCLRRGQGRVEIPYTVAVKSALAAARTPMTVGSLADDLAEQFTAVSRPTIMAMIQRLVAEGFLVTCLRVPSTVTDPLGHLLQVLDAVGAAEIGAVDALVCDLRTVHSQVVMHNAVEPTMAGPMRGTLVAGMRELVPALRRGPLAADLRLDAELELPELVGQEMEAAASVLLRLTPRRSAHEVWRDYQAAFLDRYGVGTLVPLLELVHPDRGLGFPATYPGSSFDPPRPRSSERDGQLFALIHEAAVKGCEEIVLDDAAVRALAPNEIGVARTPPHVELCARIRARSLSALETGEFSLVVRPARAAGTMTGRFTGEAPGELGKVFASLPTGDADAVAAQLSFPPAYPHAENIARVPRFLTDIISLGEHRHPATDGLIELGDLAVTADWDRLRLVCISRNRPVEPQVFHALRLDKQPPPLVRFLVNLPRAFAAGYTAWDWGLAAGLRSLPRVRYRRCVLSPARWRVPATDLPTANAVWEDWHASLHRWARRYVLPDSVELHDGDRALRLDLTVDAHATLLRDHLTRNGAAVLTEADDTADYGWLNGHAHEIAVPLAATRPPAASPLSTGRRRPLLAAATHGVLPAAPTGDWFFAKLFVHPDQQASVITKHLPPLLEWLYSELGRVPQWWFVRYRSAHESDHLRLRIQVAGPDEYERCTGAVGRLADRLRATGILRGLQLETYHPEVGRYGAGAAMAAAEAAFSADSRAVLLQLQVPETVTHQIALAATSMVDIASGFVGTAGARWLIDNAHGDNPPTPPDVREQALALTRSNEIERMFGKELIMAYAERRAALNAYRKILPNDLDPDAVLGSLLHMHHIRAVGLDRDSERLCRRLARAVAGLAICQESSREEKGRR